ncbi:hypothetical protein D3C76_1828500 [compost metagenome]
MPEGKLKPALPFGVSDPANPAHLDNAAVLGGSWIFIPDQPVTQNLGSRLQLVIGRVRVNAKGLCEVERIQLHRERLV